ncbi:MAG TPA: DUF5995 family protein [Nocardioides sp.]
MGRIRGRTRIVAAATTAALAGILHGPVPVAAEPSPLVVGLGTLLDSTIALLPPAPAEHTPYAGQTCPDGSSTCIDATIARMQERLAGLAESCEHSVIFSLAYLRVTEDVREAVREGDYIDPVWLGQIDAVFAEDYFETVANWEAGRKDLVPRAWQIALAAEDDRSMSALGNFMLAMNAHINRDFPHVTAEVGLTGADGTSHKRDHDIYNKRLDALLDPVFTEMAARFDPTFDDLDISVPAAVIMRGWREMVWRHAEALVLAPTPAAKRLVVQEIEAYAAAQALMIRTMFAIPDSTERDAWCAQHGRG